MSDERQFIERVRQSLDERAGELEPHLAARLRSARRTALAARRPPRHVWAPALAAASLAAVFVGVMWFNTERGNGDLDAGLLQASLDNGATDFELLTRSEELELYERLEFYYWLEQRNTSAG